MARKLKLKMLYAKLELEAKLNRGRTIKKEDEETVVKDKSRKRKHKKGPKKVNITVESP